MVASAAFCRQFFKQEAVVGLFARTHDEDWDWRREDLLTVVCRKIALGEVKSDYLRKIGLWTATAVGVGRDTVQLRLTVILIQSVDSQQQRGFDPHALPQQPSVINQQTNKLLAPTSDHCSGRWRGYSPATFDGHLDTERWLPTIERLWPPCVATTAICNWLTDKWTLSTYIRSQLALKSGRRRLNLSWW